MNNIKVSKKPPYKNTLPQDVGKRSDELTPAEYREYRLMVELPNT